MKESQDRILTPDVLIVGAGIAGCPMAVALHAQGLDVLLVERSPAPRRVFKGEYLQPAAVHALNELGFAEVFSSSNSSSQIESLRFRDVDSRGQLVSTLTMSYPENTYARSIEYFDLLTGFNKVAQRTLGDKFWQGLSLEPTLSSQKPPFAAKPQFTCQHPSLGEVRIQPKWVIGCDGRASSVRKWIGGKPPSKNGKVVLGTGEEFIFGTQLHEAVAQPSLYEVVRTPGKGTISYFSLGQAGQRIYLSSAARRSLDAQAMSRAFRRILTSLQPITAHQHIPEQLPVSGYPANTEWFGPAAQGRVLLAGDALAVTTPYGGQGMTVAMEHVRFLSTKFDWDAKTATARQRTEHAYEEFAKMTHERVSFLNFGLYYTFFARHSITKYSTRHIIETWERNGALKSRVARLFGGLDTDTPTLLEILDLQRFPLTTASRLTPGLIRKRLQWA